MSAEAQELLRPRRPISSFREAVDFIEEGLNYEKSQRWKYNRKWLDLSRMEGLLHALGDPHRGYNIIHVAGTKGKGSTSGAIAHCLSETGYCTGLLTSPHLVTPCERAIVDGQMISEEAFWRIARKMQPYVEAKRREKEASGLRAPTYFEMLTALPLEYFTERNVEWAVVEVGLGGRLDATNVVTPCCCVITAIGFDHTDKLGTTPGCIAAEKAGILKPGVPVILGRQQYRGALAVLRRAAQERGCPRWEVGGELRFSNRRAAAAPAHSAFAEVGWHFNLRTPVRNYENLFTPLLGAHQLDNLAAAVGALEMAAGHGGLNIDPDRIAAAIAAFRIPARVQVLQKAPALVLDVAHTVESITALMQALDTHFPGRRLRLVFGCSADKNVHGMLRTLRGRCESLTVTQARLPRALPAAELAGAARKAGVADDGHTRIITDAWEAVQATLSEADPEDVVCVTGSFFVAGEVFDGWRQARAPAPSGRNATMDNRKRINIKPHHFIDILGDVGRGQTEWQPASAYGHALHRVAQSLMENRDACIRIEVGIDDICEPCVHHVGETCDDVRSRPFPGQPSGKMEWNLMLDRAWCNLLGLQQGQELTAREFCALVRRAVSLDALRRIYSGQPEELTQKRYKDLLAGLNIFCSGKGQQG